MATINLESASRDELLEILELTGPWGSDKDSKFYLYRPNPIPAYFHSSQAKVRALLGGNRSSKTYSMVVDFTSSFLGEAPKSIAETFPKWRLNVDQRNRICTIDYPNNFQKIMWPYFQMMIPDSKVKDVIRDQGRVKAITNFHEGFVEFMQYEQDVTKFQGSSRHRIGYDEEPPESIRDENLVRLVDTDGEEVFALTPVSEIDRPVLWIYDKLFKKAGRVVEKMGDGSISDISNPVGDPLIHVFFASIFDNRAISRSSAERILSNFTENERLVREKGHFLFQTGLIFKEYNDSTHLIPDFEWWKMDGTLYAGIDTHPRTETAVLFVWVDKYNTIYIVDELYVPLAGRLKEFVSAYKTTKMGWTEELLLIEPASYIPDPSTGECLAYKLIDAGMDNPMPRPASKDLSGGLILTREYLAEPNKVKVCAGCKRFRYEIGHYRWDNWRKDTATTKDPKQKPVDKDDHMMENFRRILQANPIYVPKQEINEDIEWYKRRVNNGY